MPPWRAREETPLFEAIPSEQRGKVNSEVLRAITPYYDGVQVNFTATVCLVSASRARLSDVP
jgi:hypothetical protein